MTIQPLSLSNLPAELVIKTVLFLDLESVLKVSRVSKEFYRSADQNEVWRGLASKMEVPERLVNDPKYFAKDVVVSRILKRVSAFGLLESIDKNFPSQKLEAAKTDLQKYKVVINWFAKNSDAFEILYLEGVIFSNPEVYPLLWETDQHSALIQKDHTQGQEQRKRKGFAT
ncbi:MAG TPA: F-box protein [Rhabdochlamydiaceae bacterium]|jgi:hypothetical protein